MNHHEMSRTDSFRRIKVFGTESAADFPAASKGGELFGRLETKITNIDAANAGQDSAKGDVRQGYAGKGTARENLRASLQSISNTAVGAAYDVPGLDVKYHLQVELSDDEMFAHGQSVLADAVEDKALLMLWGEEENFLEVLAGAVEDFSQALSETSAATGEQVGATANISEEVREGMVIRRQLNVVRNKYKNNPGKLAAWESACHIEHPAKNNDKDKPEDNDEPETDVEK
jgi:hypothetical protein